MTDASISFPRQNARTLGFSLGVPHAFAIAPDGSRIAFLRALSGTDRSTGLWVRDTATGAERLVADPRELMAGGVDFTFFDAAGNFLQGRCAADG